jgi:cation transport ATPase
VNLVHRQVTMDTLVSIGTLTAYLWSVWALVVLDAAELHGGMRLSVTGLPDVYLETAAAIVTAILLGRWFEHRAKGRSSQAIAKLLELGPRTATLADGREVASRSSSPVTASSSGRGSASPSTRASSRAARRRHVDADRRAAARRRRPR